MIFDDISRLKTYHISQADKILDFISKNDCSKLPCGQIDIDGDSLFVRVMEYEPKPADQNKFETHKVYADLQYVVCGAELMQMATPESLKPISEYDLKGDYQFFYRRSRSCGAGG